MSRTSTLSKNTIGLLGAVLAGGMTLSGSVFASQPLTQGYLLASAEQVVKTPEGKCGEGKCGDASMAKTDTDGDGQVSRAEFLKVAPKADFDKIDTNHDGQISEQEAFDNVKANYEANGKKMPKGLFEHLKVSSPEIGLHLFHPNARCTASGVLYFKDRCGRSWL